MVRFCQFCNRRLDCRSVAEQDEHEFNCVGKTQSSLLSIIVNKTSEDGLNLSPEIPPKASVPNKPSPEAAVAEKITEKVPRKCHICRKPLRGSLEDRQTHIMKCSNKAKLNDTQTYEHVVNERNYSSDSAAEEPAPKPKRKTKSPKKRGRKSKKLEPALVESSYFQQEIKADEPSTSKEPPKAAPVRQAFFKLIFSPPRRPESDGDSTDYSFEIDDNPNLVVNNDVFKDFAKIRVFTDSQKEIKQKKKDENTTENNENPENDAAFAEIPNSPIQEPSPPPIPADDLQEVGSPELPSSPEHPSSPERPPSPDLSPSPELPAIPENFSDDQMESNIVNFAENIELPQDESCSPPFYLNVRSPQTKPSNSQLRESSVQKKRKSSEIIGNSSKIARKEYEMPSSSLAARPLGGWKSPERNTQKPPTRSSSIKRQLEESQTEFNILPLNETVSQLKADALKDGDLVKYSKCGKKLRFHSLWIQIRCPQLKRADTKRLTFAELQALHDAVYSPKDSFSQREMSFEGESTLEANPEVADLPLPSQNHMPKFDSSQKSNSSSSLSQVPETQPEDMADISFISPIIRRSFDAKIFNEKKKPAEEKNLAEKRSNTPICISSEDEHNVMKEKENQLDFLDETGEPSLIIQTTHGRTAEKSKEGLGLDLTEDKDESDDEFEATPPWIIKHPCVSRPRIEPPQQKTTGKVKEIADVDENDSFGNLSNNSETLFGGNSSSQELAKENTGALGNLAASLLAEGAGTAPFSSEKKTVPAAQERETSPDFEINSPQHNFSYCNEQFDDFNDIQMPDFYSQSQNANGSFSWGPKAPRTTTIPEISEEPPIVLSSDEGEKTLAEPHDLSDPPQLDQTRLSGFNEKISFCQERQTEEFDLGLSEILEKTLPNSAPTTPQKQKKSKNSKEPEKAGKAGRSLTRKSISLHAGPVKSSFIPSPAQKAALEEATAKYQKMPKEDLIKECEKYGMKSKLSKTAMIGKLKEIFMFQKLHQNGFSSAKRVVFPAKEKLDRKVIKYMTQDRNISSEDEESGNQAVEAFEEISEEQAELNKMNRVTEMIQSLPFLHKRVVMYDVIGLMELESHCLDAGLQVDEQFLIRYCDKTCITFRQENRRAVKGNLRAKRKKRK